MVLVQAESLEGIQRVVALLEPGEFTSVLLREIRVLNFEGRVELIISCLGCKPTSSRLPEVNPVFIILS